MKLEIQNVTKEFKNKTAVNDFSVELQTGECVGLIGPNGAGKTTLIKIIANIIKPTKGKVLMDGKDISKMKHKIGYLPQYPKFYEWMSTNEMLYFFGQLSEISKEELDTSIPEVVSKVGLEGEEDTKVGTFSGGMKQRLGIAQTLLHKPSLIIMDEPVSSLDPIGRREVLNIFEDIKKDTTILFSTHILGDAEEICERLIIIKDGEKIEDTTMFDLLNKNSQNKIRIDIATESKDWIDVVEKLDYVKSMEVTGNNIKVEVEDIRLNKNMLLRNALKHNANIIKFEISNDSLEEIFLGMVVER